jgi:hypothetical protein
MFQEKINEVPAGSSRVGTILIETNSLKRELTEMPKKVHNSIK